MLAPANSPHVDGCACRSGPITPPGPEVLTSVAGSTGLPENHPALGQLLTHFWQKGYRAQCLHAAVKAAVDMVEGPQTAAPTVAFVDTGITPEVMQAMELGRSGRLMCPTCGADFEPGTAVCAHCGTALLSTAGETSFTTAPRHCDRCGAAVTDPGEIECPACGAALPAPGTQTAEMGALAATPPARPVEPESPDVFIRPTAESSEPFVPWTPEMAYESGVIERALGGRFPSTCPACGGNAYRVMPLRGSQFRRRCTRCGAAYDYGRVSA